MKWLRQYRSHRSGPDIVNVERQAQAWRRASRRAGWRIPATAFRQLPAPPILTPTDRADGFLGVILSYGFAHADADESDAILSGKRAWEFRLSTLVDKNMAVPVH